MVTACSDPPELTERELLEQQAGQAVPAVARHLARCAYCRERAEGLFGLHDQMLAALFRADCPSPLELGEYHLGLAAPDRRTVIRRHLTECRHCLGEMAQLESYLEQLAPSLETSPLAQVKVLIGRLLGAGDAGGRDRSRLPGLTPALAGLRGDQAGPRVYQAEGIQVTVDAQPDPQRPDSLVILGLVTGADTDGWQAQVKRAGQPVASAAVDALGNFYIAGLAAGQYDLALGDAVVEVRLEAVDLS